ncbi:MAG: hypothetical protein KGL95_13590, partial [Patescibacteria group bacterium]|nr:hypothetical protein [Patescibacteria group bacterium]
RRVTPREPSDAVQGGRRGRATIVTVGGYTPDTSTAFNPVASPSAPIAPRTPLALPVRAR